MPAGLIEGLIAFTLGQAEPRILKVVKLDVLDLHSWSDQHAAVAEIIITAVLLWYGRTAVPSARVQSINTADTYVPSNIITQIFNHPTTPRHLYNRSLHTKFKVPTLRHVEAIASKRVVSVNLS